MADLATPDPKSPTNDTNSVAILMVDDIPLNLDALEDVLAPLGHRLRRANSGEEALRFLLKEDFALIILDAKMPGMSGFEVAALMRERERSKSTPIIFLTGELFTREMVFKGYRSGAIDYLQKPPLAEILPAKVQGFADLALMRQRLVDEIDERKRVEWALRQKQEENETLIKDLQDALGKVKTLSGLLPICAWCKKIRDDQGYWQAVEVYVKSFADVDFTHGICPGCYESKVKTQLDKLKQEKLAKLNAQADNK